MTALTKDDYRNWILARMAELKRDYPSYSKKARWRTAQDEWNELRRQQRCAERAQANGAFTPSTREQRGRRLL
jgi:hypothetical protein